MPSPDKVAGFALAALLAGDGNAGSVQDQVGAPFLEAVRAALAKVARASDKREALTALIQRVRPQPTTLEGLPKTAQALLRRNLAKRAPLRPGYDPDPQLVAMLRRLAARIETRRGPA